MLATWGNKEFFISSKQIKSLYDISEDFSIDISSEQNENGKSTTVLKGDSPNSLSFSIDLNVIFGNNVQLEFNSWKSELFNKKPHLFLFGESLLSNSPYILKNIAASKHQYTADGILIAVSLKLSFEETPELITNTEFAARKKAKEAIEKGNKS